MGVARGYRVPLFVVLLLAGLVLVPSANAATPSFSLTPIGQFAPMGINEAGRVVGFGGYPTKAFLYTGGGGLVTLPPLPGYASADAQEINESGYVVGTSGIVESKSRATLWVNGQPQDLGSLVTGGNSTARAINDAGTVVGSANVGSQTHAFVKPFGGAMIDITPGAWLATAEDVNSFGEVTGRIDSVPFRWKNGQLQILGGPIGYPYGSGFGINDSGVIAAAVSNAYGNSERVARHVPGVGWQIIGGSGETNVGWAINSSGTLVGEGFSVGMETPAVQAFISPQGTGFFAVEDFVATTDWFLLAAYDVNDAGQMVAFGSSRIGSTPSSALLLSPQAPPGPNAMHVGDISVGLTKRGGKVIGSASVPILSSTGAPVAGAVVTGDWLVNGLVAQTGAKATTGTSGNAVVRSTKLTAPQGATVKFCVTDVAHASYTYAPGSNVETCASAVV